MTIRDLLVNTLPLVAFIVVWVVLNRKHQGQYRQHVEQVNSINARILEVNERMVRTLEEIKALLQDRKS